jgi:hypothetical protein
MVRHLGVDGSLFGEPPVPPQSPSNRMDGPRRTGGRFAPHRRTVRQVQSDSPAHCADSLFCPLFFYFSLIYSEIKI